MPAKVLHDTISDKTGHRVKVEGKTNDELSYQYSNGAEVVMKVSDPGVPGVMNPVKEAVRVYAPKTRMTIPYKPGQYERIFGKKEGNA